jgi:hypothetical protein
MDGMNFIRRNEIYYIFIGLTFFNSVFGSLIWSSCRFSRPTCFLSALKASDFCRAPAERERFLAFFPPPMRPIRR